MTNWELEMSLSSLNGIKQWEVIEFKDVYALVYKIEAETYGYKLSCRILRVSKYKWIRKLQLRVFKKMFQL